MLADLKKSRFKKCSGIQEIVRGCENCMHISTMLGNLKNFRFEKLFADLKKFHGFENR
jgi:hypothetical protein